MVPKILLSTIKPHKSISFVASKTLLNCPFLIARCLGENYLRSSSKAIELGVGADLICLCGFCGWCLQDCGTNAHEHVHACPQRAAGADVCFVSPADIGESLAETAKGAQPEIFDGPELASVKNKIVEACRAGLNCRHSIFGPSLMLRRRRWRRRRRRVSSKPLRRIPLTLRNFC